MKKWFTHKWYGWITVAVCFIPCLAIVFTREMHSSDLLMILSVVLFILGSISIACKLYFNGQNSVDTQVDFGFPPPNPTNQPFAGSGGYVTGGCIEPKEDARKIEEQQRR